MTDHAAILRQIFTEARPLVEQALDLTEQFAAFRELATNNGLDWSQIKALLKAQVQDERDGSGSKRIDRVIEKADFATAYADMLGLGSAKMNEFKSFGAERFSPSEDGEVPWDHPPHDPSTGEIIEELGPESAIGASGPGEALLASGDAEEDTPKGESLGGGPVHASPNNSVVPTVGLTSEPAANAIEQVTVGSQLNVGPAYSAGDRAPETAGEGGRGSRAEPFMTSPAGPDGFPDLPPQFDRRRVAA